MPGIRVFTFKEAVGFVWNGRNDINVFKVSPSAKEILEQIMVEEGDAVGK